MNKPVLLCCLMSVTSQPLHAAEWKLSGGMSLWQSSGEASLLAPDYDNYQLAITETSTDTNGSLFAHLETPGPYWPDIDLAYHAIRQNGNGTFSNDNFPVAIPVNGKIDLSHADLTLRYSPLNKQWLTLDIGLTGRFFFGDITVTFPTFSQQASSPLSSELVMLFLRGVWHTPLEHLDLALQFEGGDAGSENADDIRAQATYHLVQPGIDVFAGYRHFATDLNGQAITNAGFKVDIDADLDVSGPFVGAAYRFPSF